MRNLFSIFDPVSFIGLRANWLSAVTLFIVIPTSFWVCSFQAKKIVNFILQAIYQEFKSILGAGRAPGTVWVRIRVFIFIWLNNFLGLMPYIFTATSHLVFTLSLAFPIWVGHVAMVWVRTPESVLAHLVPLGSPGALSPFMVLIELVRAVIRPLTLSVRLAANIVAGHLLMVLLSTPASRGGGGVLLLIIGALVILALLESAVATIQSYVFRILSVLYLGEVDSEKLG